MRKTRYRSRTLLLLPLPPPSPPPGRHRFFISCLLIMKLVHLLPLFTFGLAASPVLSQVQAWEKRGDNLAQLTFTRPITPPTLDHYISEAIAGVRMINDSFNIALSTGKFVPTPYQQKLNKAGTFRMTAALADAAEALNKNLIKIEINTARKALEQLARDVLPIAKRVGNLKVSLNEKAQTLCGHSITV